MIIDAINRIEQINDLENVALKYHSPSRATYVIVDKDFNYKIISKDRFSFNTKYVAMDFYSQIIELNKAVDKKKLITSNNYLTFFCKNVGKLTSEIIDNYYKALETPTSSLIYRDWIKENISKLSGLINSKELIKVFFIKDLEEYIYLGKNYLKKNILSNKTKINEKTYGTPMLLNTNSKKPYLKNLTRKLELPSIVTVDEAIKYKYFTDILLSLAKNGYELLYVLETGELLPINIKKGEMPKREFVNVYNFVYRIDTRGKLGILDMDIVPRFTNTLNNFSLKDVLSLQEAAKMWGLDDSTLRKAIANDKFYPYEYRKTGRNYIIAKSSMERVFGKLNKE